MMRSFIKPAVLCICLLVGCSRAPDDRQIAANVRSVIQQNRAIHGEVQAQSVQGLVSLSGYVESEAERQLASRDAAAVAGVKQVLNHLTVAAAEEPEEAQALLAD